MKPAGPALRLSSSELETLLAVTRHLAAPFELAQMLAEVADAACSVLHAERGSVWLLDGDSLVLEVSRDIGHIRVPLGHGLVGACARDRVILNVPDCHADPRFDASVDRRSGFHTRCSLTLPLADPEGRLVGVLQLLNKRGGVFGAGDVALAEALAAQCAVALARARFVAQSLEAERLGQALELARVVQMSSLPRTLPQLPGYEMHATFLPAEQTGGDTYDLTPVGDKLLVVLADAAGHGVAPALSVTQMQAMLRMAFRLGAPLEAVFHEVNDLLAESLPEGHFVTAFIGLLDPAAHGLRFISGGQAPILFHRAADDSVQAYRATSFPMGAMALPARRAAVELAMAPGDLLVLLSDGVFEQESRDGQAFGRERVEALLRRHRGDTPASLSARLLDAMREHAGGLPQDDDVTMVLLRRMPAA